MALKKSADQEYLALLYQSLETAMRASGKLRFDSVLLSLLELTNNGRYDLLNKSALGPALLGSSELADLTETGLVRESAEANRYSLTARGLWKVETSRGVLSEKAMIDHFDSKFFPKSAGTATLSEKEKVILLGFAAARCFGSEQALDLHQPDFVKEKWKEVFLRCFDALRAAGQIPKLKRDELFGKKLGNEHPVSNLVRHTDALKMKTRGLFNALGNQRYCLEVTTSDGLDSERLAMLFGQILGTQTDAASVPEFIELCRTVANDDCIYIYDVDKAKFFGAEMDETMRNSIMASAGLA